MISLVRRHLVLKLSLALVLTTALGFLLFGVTGTIAARRTLSRQHRSSAASLSRAIESGVRNAMLQGRGIAVREMLDDARRGVEHATVRVYAPSGEQVFAPPPPAPPRASLPAPLALALETGRSSEQAS